MPPFLLWGRRWPFAEGGLVPVSPCSYSEMLAFTLTAFLELMDHGVVSWDTVSISFIKQVLQPPPRLRTAAALLPSGQEGPPPSGCLEEGGGGVPSSWGWGAEHRGAGGDRPGVGGSRASGSAQAAAFLLLPPPRRLRGT